VTLPTSIVEVYDPLEGPYDNLYPAIFSSGFAFHVAVAVAACAAVTAVNNNEIATNKTIPICEDARATRDGMTEIDMA
jgi:hypothetical protein